jgi:hypothetical protein
MDTIRTNLSLPAGSRLEAQLHKLLVYEPGQFFVTLSRGRIASRADRPRAPHHVMRAATALLLAGALLDAGAAVFGWDQREPYDEAAALSLGIDLGAIGTIICLDGFEGTGFVVDVSNYVADEPDFHVVATAAKTLVDPETGLSRGRCAYRPASSPTVYLELRDTLVGAERHDGAADGNWAFARLDKSTYLGGIPVTFADTYDFGKSYKPELWAIGFDEEIGEFVASTRCRLDDKSSYLFLGTRGKGLDKMIIHDCDFVGAAEGGPLVLRDADGVHVIAINAGDSSEKRFPRLTAVPYDPKRNFYNFSRRFDLELEQKLVAFVSRFGHLKNPPQAIKARSELIHKVQSNLGRLGYDAGPVDGFLGDKTRDAIKAFQTSLGITPTGRVSEELLLLLELK